MQVILVKDVETLGESGELKSVSDGYARNYLLPQGFVIAATPAALEDLERRRERLRQKAEKKHQDDLEKASQIEALGVLTIVVRASIESGKLYGAVTTKDIARLVTEKSEFEVDRKSIKLSHPINRLGDYELQIRLSPRVMATLRLTVVADDESA